jgi:hypothetical protein
MKMTVEHSLEEIAATPLHLSDKVHSNALRLEELILSSPFPPSRESEIVDRLKRQGQLVKLQRLYEAFETNLERNFARRLLEDDHVRETDYLLYGRFEKLIRNEIELAEIQSSDRVIFIGSGPFPISAILMSRLTGCAVHCYDKRLDFVKMSTEVVSIQSP